MHFTNIGYDIQSVKNSEIKTIAPESPSMFLFEVKETEVSDHINWIDKKNSSVDDFISNVIAKTFKGNYHLSLLLLLINLSNKVNFHHITSKSFSIV